MQAPNSKRKRIEKIFPPRQQLRGCSRTQMRNGWIKAQAVEMVKRNRFYLVIHKSTRARVPSSQRGGGKVTQGVESGGPVGLRLKGGKDSGSPKGVKAMRLQTGLGGNADCKGSPCPDSPFSPWVGWLRWKAHLRGFTHSHWQQLKPACSNLLSQALTTPDLLCSTVSSLVLQSVTFILYRCKNWGLSAYHTQYTLKRCLLLGMTEWERLSRICS